MGNIFESPLFEFDTSRAAPAGDLPPFISEAEFGARVHPLSKQLFFDVASASDGGKKKIVVSDHDMFWHLLDRLDQNKGKLAVTVATTVATGLITMGVGPVIGLGGKIISWAAIQAFVALRVYSKRKKIKSFKEQGGTSTKKIQETIRNYQTGKEQTFDVVVKNESYGEQILDDVRYVIQNSDFTNIHDSFADMFRDFEKFRKYFSFPKITNETGSDADQYVISAQFNPGSITSCKDAVELWELVCRFAERKNKIRAIAVMLDEFFMYVEMALSEYSATSIPTAREAWAAFPRSGKKSPRQVVDEMKAYSDRVKTGAWFRDLFGIGINLKSFYGAIPLRVKEEDFGGRYGDRVFMELLRRENPAEFKRYAAELFVSILQKNSSKPRVAKVKGSKNEILLKEKWVKSVASQGLEAGFAMLDAVFTGYVPVSLGNIANLEMPKLDEVVGAGLDIATGTLATFFEKAVVDGDALVDIAVNPETFFSQFMSGTDGAAFGVDIVVNALADMAFNWWDRRKLEQNRQTAAKRLGTMKKFAKEEIEGYVDLIDGWGTSFKKASSSGGMEQLPAVVECLRHESAMDSNMARQFFGELVLMFNKMDMLVDSVYKQSAVQINHYLHAHTHAVGDAMSGSFQTTFCKGICYNSASNGMKRLVMLAAKGVPMQDQKLRTDLQAFAGKLHGNQEFQSIPCSPVPAPGGGTANLVNKLRAAFKAQGLKL